MNIVYEKEIFILFTSEVEGDNAFSKLIWSENITKLLYTWYLSLLN